MTPIFGQARAAFLLLMLLPAKALLYLKAITNSHTWQAYHGDPGLACNNQPEESEKSLGAWQWRRMIS
jgi:hypothetical protein